MYNSTTRDIQISEKYPAIIQIPIISSIHIIFITYNITYIFFCVCCLITKLSPWWVPNCHAVWQSAGAALLQSTVITLLCCLDVGNFIN